MTFWNHRRNQPQGICNSLLSFNRLILFFTFLLINHMILPGFASAGTGKIKGKVRRYHDQAPLRYITVTAFLSDSNTPKGNDKTDANGDYEITGLDAGKYRVCAKDPNIQYVTECYQTGCTGRNCGFYWYIDPEDKADSEFNLAEGQTRSGVDFYLLRGAQFEGDVITDANSYTFRVVVEGTAEYKNAKPVPVTFFANKDLQMQDKVTPYNTPFELPRGEYTIKAEDNDAEYPFYHMSYYNGKVTMDQAYKFAVGSDQDTLFSDIDLYLYTGGVIRGNVKEYKGKGINNIKISVKDLNNGFTRYTRTVFYQPDPNDPTTIQGEYAVTGLPTGNYIIKAEDTFIPDELARLYIPEYYYDQSTEDEAWQCCKIHVDAGDEETVEQIVLNKAPIVRGWVMVENSHVCDPQNYISDYCNPCQLDPNFKPDQSFDPEYCNPDHSNYDPNKCPCECNVNRLNKINCDTGQCPNDYGTCLYDPQFYNYYLSNEEKYDFICNEFIQQYMCPDPEAHDYICDTEIKKYLCSAVYQFFLCTEEGEHDYICNPDIYNSYFCDPNLYKCVCHGDDSSVSCNPANYNKAYCDANIYNPTACYIKPEICGEKYYDPDVCNPDVYDRQVCLKNLPKYICDPELSDINLCDPDLQDQLCDPNQSDPYRWNPCRYDPEGCTICRHDPNYTLPGIVVRLTPELSGQSYKMDTDPNGRYAFAGGQTKILAETYPATYTIRAIDIEFDYWSSDPIQLSLNKDKVYDIYFYLTPLPDPNVGKGSIGGYVYRDEDPNLPVAGVKIQFINFFDPDPNDYVYTDSDGYFHIGDLNPGEYGILASEGYEDLTLELYKDVSLLDPEKFQEGQAMTGFDNLEKEATRILVLPGENITGIDLGLSSYKYYFGAGLNLFGYPGLPVKLYNDSYEFCAELGADAHDFRWLDPDSGLWEVTIANPGDPQNPTGDMFMLKTGKGYFIYMNGSAGPIYLPPFKAMPPSVYQLDSGKNFISYPSSLHRPIKMSLDLLDTIGNKNDAASVSTYDNPSGKWKSSLWFFGRPGSGNFPIQKGKGYMVDMWRSQTMETDPPNLTP